MGEILNVEVDLEIEDIPETMLDDIIKKVRLYELSHIFNESQKFFDGISFFDERVICIDEKTIKLTVIKRYIDRFKKQLTEEIKNDNAQQIRSNVKL